MKCKKIEQGIMFHLDHISPCCQYDLHKPFVGTNESIPTTIEEYKNSKVIEELSAYIKELNVSHSSPETNLVHGIITGCHSLIEALKRNENEMIHTIDTIDECIDINTNMDTVMKIKNPIDLIAYFKEGQYE